MTTYSSMLCFEEEIVKKMAREVMLRRRTRRPSRNPQRELDQSSLCRVSLMFGTARTFRGAWWGGFMEDPMEDPIGDPCWGDPMEDPMGGPMEDPMEDPWWKDPIEHHMLPNTVAP